MFAVSWRLDWNMTNIQPNNETETCKVCCQCLFFLQRCQGDLGQIFPFKRVRGDLSGQDYCL